MPDPETTPIPPTFVVEVSSGRRPGGALGAPRPTSDDLAEGAVVYAWLPGGEGLTLAAIDADPEDPRGLDAGAIPWELVEWWLPLDGPTIASEPSRPA